MILRVQVVLVLLSLPEHAGLAQYEEISNFNERELSAALDCSASEEVMCPVCRKYVTYSPTPQFFVDCKSLAFNNSIQK